MNFDVITQIRLQPELILQLSQDRFPIPFLIRQDLHLQRDIVQVAFLGHDDFKFIAQPFDRPDHLFNRRRSYQNALDLRNIV